MGEIPCDGYIIRVEPGALFSVFVRDSDLLLAKESFAKTGAQTAVVAKSWD